MIVLQINNQEELQGLLALLDAAVRQLGLNGAHAAAVFQARLQQAVNMHNQAQANSATEPAMSAEIPTKPTRQPGKDKGSK